MAFLKTWSLLPLAALLLLSIVPTGAEVVTSMSKCTGFLLNETPPNIPGILEGGNIQNQNRYKPICQTFDNERRFVTLYDTKNKIPVFSAYRYRGTSGSQRHKAVWKIEPQLENKRGNKNMNRADKGKHTHQAGVSDYRNKKGFSRRHLHPSSYALNKTDKKSTFTLTNAVPQVSTFNQGSWKAMETCTRCVLDKYCINNNGAVEAFLVTGAQPGTQTLNHKVNVPSMLWSAFCCYSSTEKMWLAGAHWGDNSNDTKSLQTKTLGELHNKLGSFEVFPGSQCPLTTTVTHLYPKLKRSCNCPRSISTSSTPPTTTSTPPTTAPSPLHTTSSQWILHCVCKGRVCRMSYKKRGDISH